MNAMHTICASDDGNVMRISMHGRIKGLMALLHMHLRQQLPHTILQNNSRQRQVPRRTAGYAWQAELSHGWSTSHRTAVHSHWCAPTHNQGTLAARAHASARTGLTCMHACSLLGILNIASTFKRISKAQHLPVAQIKGLRALTKHAGLAHMQDGSRITLRGQSCVPHIITLGTV